MSDLSVFEKYFRSVNHFDRDHGATFEIIRPGEVIYRMKIQEKHLSSPGVAHGGSVAGFMDCVLGLAALSWAITQGKLTSTVEFKLNFLRPVRLGDELVGTGKVIHHGKTLIMSTAEVKLARGEQVAQAQGTFNTYPLEKKATSMLYSPTRINPAARKTLMIAAILMLTGVALGAFGAHGLKKMVAPHLLETWETGARYWLYHGLALLALGSITLNTQMPLKWPVRLLVAGTLLFSGNCFLYVLSGVKAFAIIVPIGGTLLLVGWGWFIWELGFFTRKSL